MFKHYKNIIRANQNVKFLSEIMAKAYEDFWQNNFCAKALIETDHRYRSIKQQEFYALVFNEILSELIEIGEEMETLAKTNKGVQ